MPETHIRKITRSPRTRLRVTFGDGSVLEEHQASDTFALVLSRFGLARVEAMDIYVRNLPLVGSAKSNHYASQTEIDGKYICHHSDNKGKKKLLEKIAKRLSTPIRVEIVPSV